MERFEVRRIVRQEVDKIIAYVGMLCVATGSFVAFLVGAYFMLRVSIWGGMGLNK